MDWVKVDQKYAEAKTNLQRILPFEKTLAELDAKAHQDRADIYAEYIEEGKEFLTEQNVQVLYERMVTDCCLNCEFSQGIISKTIFFNFFF